VLGPAPSGQECGAANGSLVHVDELKLVSTTLEGTGLLGRIQAFAN
jgi:hypothetical protein